MIFKLPEIKLARTHRCCNTPCRPSRRSALQRLRRRRATRRANVAGAMGTNITCGTLRQTAQQMSRPRFISRRLPSGHKPSSPYRINRKDVVALYSTSSVDQGKIIRCHNRLVNKVKDLGLRVYTNNKKTRLENHRLRWRLIVWNRKLFEGQQICW